MIDDDTLNKLSKEVAAEYGIPLDMLEPLPDGHMLDTMATAVMDVSYANSKRMMHQFMHYVLRRKEEKANE